MRRITYNLCAKASLIEFEKWSRFDCPWLPLRRAVDDLPSIGSDKGMRYVRTEAAQPEHERLLGVKFIDIHSRGLQVW